MSGRFSYLHRDFGLNCTRKKFCVESAEVSPVVLLPYVPIVDFSGSTNCSCLTAEPGQSRCPHAYSTVLGVVPIQAVCFANNPSLLKLSRGTMLELEADIWSVSSPVPLSADEECAL